jgi:hypothetical protein
MASLPAFTSGAVPTRKTRARRVALGVIFLGLTALNASAAWGDLKTGLDQRGATQHVGAPLIETTGRGGVLVTWIYDDGGYVLFEHGKIRYWQAPRVKKS